MAPEQGKSSEAVLYGCLILKHNTVFRMFTLPRTKKNLPTLYTKHSYLFTGRRTELGLDTRRVTAIFTISEWDTKQFVISTNEIQFREEMLRFCSTGTFLSLHLFVIQKINVYSERKTDSDASCFCL